MVVTEIIRGRLRSGGVLDTDGAAKRSKAEIGMVAATKACSKTA